MNVFLFLKGELRQSKGVFFGLTVLLALALAVAVSVIQTERMVKSSTIRAADQFDILVGTKGSRSALLLGTVYLRDEMLSLVPMPVLNNLSPQEFRHQLGRAACLRRQSRQSFSSGYHSSIR